MFDENRLNSQGVDASIAEMRYASAKFSLYLEQVIEKNSLTMINMDKTPSYFQLDSHKVAKTMIDNLHREICQLSYSTRAACALEVALIAVQLECMGIVLHPYIKAVLQNMELIAYARRA